MEPQESHIGRAVTFFSASLGTALAMMASSLRVFVPLCVAVLAIGCGAYWMVQEQYLRYRPRWMRIPALVVMVAVALAVFWNPMTDQWEREHPSRVVQATPPSPSVIPSPTLLTPKAAPTPSASVASTPAKKERTASDATPKNGPTITQQNIYGTNIGTIAGPVTIGAERRKWSLVDSQLREISRVISDSPIANLTNVSCVLGDADSKRLAQALIDTFKGAGWVTDRKTPDESAFKPENPRGIIFRVASREDAESNKWVTAMILKLREFGLEAGASIRPEIPHGQVHLIVGNRPWDD